MALHKTHPELLETDFGVSIHEALCLTFVSMSYLGGHQLKEDAAVIPYLFAYKNRLILRPYFQNKRKKGFFCYPKMQAILSAKPVFFLVHTISFYSCL